MIYLIGTIVFSAVIMLLVGLLLLVEAKVVLKGDRSVTINGDADKILQVDTGTSLLKALSNNNIFYPIRLWRRRILRHVQVQGRRRRPKLSAHGAGPYQPQRKEGEYPPGVSAQGERGSEDPDS